MSDLQKIFISGLSNMLDAENQLVKALPEMAEAAHSEELRDAFLQHLEQTKGHVRRVEEAFRSFGQEPRSRDCAGMEGLIDEGQIIATEFEENAGLDVALICAAQKVEHYEISSYGALCTWAELLDYSEALGLLKENLSEEKETDEKLTEMAASHFNRDALVTDTGKRGESASTFRKVVTSGT